MRWIFWCLIRLYIRLFHPVSVYGKENMVDGPALYVCNHTSLLDAVVLAVSLPHPPKFVMAKSMAKPVVFSLSFDWFFNVLTRFALRYIDVFLVDESSSYVVKHMVQAVRDSSSLMIFPEGRVTITGRLMKVYDGAGFVAQKTGVPVVPMALSGLESSFFSYVGNIFKKKIRSPVALSIGQPFTIGAMDDMGLRERRMECVRRVEGALMEVLYEQDKMMHRKQDTVWKGFQEIVSSSPKAMCLHEPLGRPVTYKRINIMTRVLGRVLDRTLTSVSEDYPEQNIDGIGSIVGVLLPNSIGSSVTYLSLMAYGRVFHPMNPSTGVSGMVSICKTLGINTVVTSKRFVDKAKMQPVIEALSQSVIVVYLEDVKETITLSDKISSLFKRRVPGNNVKETQCCVVLATSGSEGAPKGVALSHQNIMANIRQIKSVIDFTPKDIVFNAMPTFHSFGLTGGLFLPLVNGLKSFQYPTPLHYRAIPQAIYMSNATVCFGTDTFLRKWADYAKAEEFQNVRFMVAGAEKVKQSTHDLYLNKLHTPVYEGYGATETAPVIALNTPKYNATGSVGKLLPDMKMRLEKMTGVEGQRLLVSGPNIMMGYIRPTQPCVLEKSDTWYDTGDIVTICDGYISIQGRAKRFAKVAGEMVPLSGAEDLLYALSPKHIHAVIAQPDDRKGEALVAFTQDETLTPKDILQYARNHGIPEIMVPRILKTIDKIPLLGTGKVDYPTLTKTL